MKTWKQRKNLHLELMTGAPDKAAALPAAGVSAEPAPLPDDVLDWLTQLTLLYGVPFEYLVPDARLLPVESLRFFYIDRNWLDRLVDGAMSIGTNSTRDNVCYENHSQAIYAQIDVNLTRLRSVLRAKPAPAEVLAGGIMSGLIFRSVVVSGWPGLEVTATRKDGAGVDIIRMDHLSSDVLLCIFNGVPDKVEIIEPAEGLHLGVVITGPDQPQEFEIFLRGLGFPKEKPYSAGEQIKDSRDQYLKVAGKFRDGQGQPSGVIDIQGLVGAVEQNLPQGALPDDKLTPGGFAIQLLRGAGLQPFQPVEKKDKT